VLVADPELAELLASGVGGDPGTAAAARIAASLDEAVHNGQLTAWKYVRLGSHVLYATPLAVVETDEGIHW
jgi:hypothetical protein